MYVSLVGAHSKTETDRIQLFTHAELFFSNDCIEGIEYEATAGAIMIAGLFITFIIEYIAHRWIDRKRHMFERPNTAQLTTQKDATDANVSESSSHSEENFKSKSLTLNTAVMEAGIIFHSIRKLRLIYFEWNTELTTSFQ
jgi:zinc transporter 1/2/3